MIPGVEGKIIAVCSAGIDDEYNSSFLSAFYEYAGKYGFKILFFNSLSELYERNKHDAGEATIFKLINYSYVDALVLLCETFKDPSICPAIIQRALISGTPVVSIDHEVEGCYNVNFSYDLAMEKIVRHIVEDHHCTKVNFIAGIKGNSFSENRLDIYKRVLKENGLPIEDERIGYGEFWDTPTIKVMQSFFNSDVPFPEAIVCANDSMAIVAYEELIKAGYRVPEDVFVTGFDGIEEALSHSPSITTAKHNYAGAILKTFDILTDIFDGKKVEKQHYVESKVLIGTSCCQKSQPENFSPNSLVRTLHERIDNKNNTIIQKLKMAGDLTDNKTYDSLIENVKPYIFYLSTSRAWICCIDNFMKSSSKLEDILAISDAYHGEYSEQMVTIINRMNENYKEWDEPFMTSQLLPNITEAFDEHNNIMFFPLHVLDETIGYLAYVYLPQVANFYEMYLFCTHLSNALKSTKTKMQQQLIIQSLEDKYIHDPMTNLYNRRGFYQHINPLYEDCIRDRHHLMVVSVDLNGLKPINDNYGHSEGDNAIITVAKALDSISVRNEICARFGGDEFVVACAIEDNDYINDYEKRFNDYLDYYNKQSDKPYEISASFGMVVCIPSRDKTLDQCIKEADDKMYAIKKKHHLCRSRV